MKRHSPKPTERKEQMKISFPVHHERRWWDRKDLWDVAKQLVSLSNGVITLYEHWTRMK